MSKSTKIGIAALCAAALVLVSVNLHGVEDTLRLFGGIVDIIRGAD